jgi:hypothetical protein
VAGRGGASRTRSTAQWARIVGSILPIVEGQATRHREFRAKTLNRSHFQGKAVEWPCHEKFTMPTPSWHDDRVNTKRS